MSGRFYEGGWTCSECGKEFDETQVSSIYQHKYTRHGLDTESHIERYRRIRDEIPEKYLDAYEDLTGSGKSPRRFQAAVCYIESPVSQSVVSDAFNVSELTIRNTTREIIQYGVVSLEYVQENSPRAGTKGQFNGEGGQCGGQEVKHGI